MTGALFGGFMNEACSPRVGFLINAVASLVASLVSLFFCQEKEIDDEFSQRGAKVQCSRNLKDLRNALMTP